GAELSYRDLETLVRVLQWREADAEATLVAEESLDGRQSQLIELTPKGKELPYARYRVWLGTEDVRPYKAEMLDASGAVVRRLLLSDYAVIDGHATPQVVEIIAPGTNRRTVFRLRNVRYATAVPESAFSLGRLNRGR